MKAFYLLWIFLFFSIVPWDKYSISSYFADYGGRSQFAKTDTITNKIPYLRFFWKWKMTVNGIPT